MTANNHGLKLTLLFLHYFSSLQYFTVLSILKKYWKLYQTNSNELYILNELHELYVENQRTPHLWYNGGLLYIENRNVKVLKSRNFLSPAVINKRVNAM